MLCGVPSGSGRGKFSTGNRSTGIRTLIRACVPTFLCWKARNTSAGWLKIMPSPSSQASVTANRRTFSPPTGSAWVVPVLNGMRPASDERVAVR